MADTLVLVLSSAYQPLQVISWQRAIGLWFAGKVEIVEEYSDRFIRTVDEIYKVPAVVRFVGNVIKKFITKKPKLSKKNIFLRDEGTCQYCGIVLNEKTFTIDHVHPTSKGGDTSWNNIVAACSPCNRKKGSKTLDQIDMKLRKKPIRPKTLPYKSGLEKALDKAPQEWNNYII